jgi:hypothetical protein
MSKPIQPGDVVYDLAQSGTPKMQVRRVLADSVEEYAEREDFNLAEYKSHPRLPVTRDDRVVECVYLAEDPGAAPSNGNPYAVPTGRLARAPVELADEGRRVQDELRLDIFEMLFDRARALDEDATTDPPGSLVETIRLLAGGTYTPLLDEADELAEAARFGGGEADG